MTPQVVTTSELIEYLTDIVDEHGDIPVVIRSATSNEAESVGRPIALSVIHAGAAEGAQTCDYPPQEDTPRTDTTPIN